MITSPCRLTSRRLLVACALGVASLAAGAAPARAQGGPERLLEQHVFPPELVMQHQQRIGLRPAQRTAITEAIQQLQSRMVDLQWRIQEETQQLAKLLEAPTVSEEDVLEQVDLVLRIEREVKREHMTMLIRIKNALTPEQQATLRSLR